VKSIIKRLLGDPQAKTLRRLSRRAEKISALQDGYRQLSARELKAKAAGFRANLSERPDDVEKYLDEVFALTREAAERTLKMRPFDVQIIGGLALHEGTVAEMRTGEGKTLVATLPVALNAMTGRGVHVVTVNDYLAQRDAGWMGSLYHFLGLSVGVIIPYQSYIYDPDYTNEEHEDERFRHLRPAERQEAYQADVTYGTNNEFGFDYLRDNMVRSSEDLRQRNLVYAIVDEVDSILIDEARTPLIISAPATESADLYRTFARSVLQLKSTDYELDEKHRTVTLNDDGVEKMQRYLKIDNLYDPSQVQALYHLEQALRAETLFKLDKDYVVHEGEVIIVDEFTGRLMIGRRYSEGLHQAIEAKEGVEVQQESMTLATISFQNYFRLYEKLSGMTGTAVTEAEEFHTIYKLDVVSIPTNKPSCRSDLPDRIYRSESGKFKALVEDVRERHLRGQPILLGTVSVEKNEVLSRLLSKARVPHEMLNAKNNEREAAIIAKAGQQGAVTLATNIAGRGTDIVLGEGVVKLGGLHVIGSERHESRRIDNQLRGRSGRQGDPGSTQFYISTEDELMRIFGGERLKFLMERLGVDESVPIENRTVSRALESAQKKVENHNFDVRKNLVQYDDVMNRHRRAVYSKRRAMLLAEEGSDLLSSLIEEECRLIAAAVNASSRDALEEEAVLLFGLDSKAGRKLAGASTNDFGEVLQRLAAAQRKARRTQFGEDIMARLEREVSLQVLDELWMQHLENMQHLREGIRWRSVGQRDPLVEYRREGQILFENMQRDMRTTTLRLSFRAVPRIIEAEEVDTALTRAAAHSSEASGEIIGGDGRRARRRESGKAARKGDNEPRPASSTQQRLKSKRRKQGRHKKKR
jgi:preprotein translocase subunit SecA